MKQQKVKVLIIEYAATARRAIREWLQAEPEIEVVGATADPYAGRDQIVLLQPDVLVLDPETPKIDGLKFLEIIMKYHPMPVIVISPATGEDGDLALRSLKSGAADVMPKPPAFYLNREAGAQLIQKVKKASQIKQARYSAPQPLIGSRAPLPPQRKIIAIGASTGGTEAIQHVLKQLPAAIPPILVVQHMPEHFTKSFAERLNRICQFEVKEAEDQEPVCSNKALIAPGNRHMTLKRNGAGFCVAIKDGPLVYHQRPSVEILFQSVAQAAGSIAVGVILTGMGKDGATGLLALRQAGAFTIAQDEQSSVVYGMPKEAARIGAATRIAPLDKIAPTIMAFLERSSFE